MTRSLLQPNVDMAAVASFGDEWAHFDQSDRDDAERLRRCDQHIGKFPWDALAPGAQCFDRGHESRGRAKLVAPQQRRRARAKIQIMMKRAGRASSFISEGEPNWRAMGDARA